MPEENEKPSPIKKFFSESSNKWLTGIGAAILLTASTAVRDYAVRFYTLPEKVERGDKEARIQRAKDSIIATYYMFEIEKLKKRAATDSVYLMNDFEDITAIKKKLRMK